MSPLVKQWAKEVRVRFSYVVGVAFVFGVLKSGAFFLFKGD